ncbi:MAG: Cellulose binding domain protein [Firmicutes bacterium ADurb.Bin354]|nr:MAG: Cellulose binding domain protein [Firmicutes bacterium ADurb.Bin354]
MTVSFGDAGVVDVLDDEDKSDEAKEEVDSRDEEKTEKGVLESELSGEPYIFDYDSFRVEWKVVSHWEGACNVSVSLTNKSDETIHNWNLSFLSEDEIINPYNARITSEGSDGNKWTFKNLEYNQDIRSGESIQFGFQINYGERIDIPFSYSIDSSEKKVSDSDYEISDQIISSWDGGAVGELHIVNNKDTAIEDWTVTVRTDAVFLTVWGGNIKKVSEDTYEFSCPDYCQNIAPGQTAVIGYQLSGHDTSIEILGLKEWGNKDNTISGNSISDNSVSNNTISENSVSNNSVSDNSVSENKPVTYIESDGHQHIFIDSDEYELLEEGIYLLDVYSDSMTGYINYENEDQNDSDNENYNEIKVESVKLEICDVFDETIWEGDILSDDGFETWSAKDTGFVLGANKLIFDVIFSDDTALKEELIIINREASNIKNTFIELTDEDDDNIYDYYEKYFGTDPDKKDTDGDGLEDGVELFLLDTDPTDDDTDDDGIKDGDEDEDGDGLNILKEYELGTSDLSDDCDLDELSDDYEVNVLGTDPTFADTDFDKITDKEEIDLGLDPLNPDSDGDGIIDGDETITREVSKDYNGEAIDKVSVNIGCKGSMENKLFISKASDKSGILHDTAGLIGDFYDIECDADFETADIVFSYDESMLGDTDESDLRLIWYNEETREFVLLEDSVVDTENNTVSYTTTHFSDWGVVDGKAYEEAFDTPNTPGMSGTDNPYMNNDKFKCCDIA